MIIRQSPYTVKETMDRLQAAVKQRGAKIYARIDQQQELQNAGQNIHPLEFLMFGNPKAGGPAMTENPLVALDLPLKVIAWQDENGQVQIACNEAGYLKERYDLSAEVSAPFNLEPLVISILS